MQTTGRVNKSDIPAIQCIPVWLFGDGGTVCVDCESENADQHSECSRVQDHLAREVCFAMMQSYMICLHEQKTDSSRAFADYVFGSLILHFFCINFIN